MKTLLATLLLVLSLPVTASANFDSHRFIQEKCSSCHDEQVYIRPNRRVQNLAQLDAQVRRCDANLGTSLFNEDITAVVEHLNQRYYRFEP